MEEGHWWNWVLPVLFADLLKGTATVNVFVMREKMKKKEKYFFLQNNFPEMIPDLLKFGNSKLLFYIQIVK